MKRGRGASLGVPAKALGFQLDSAVIEELKSVAHRLDRSPSWLMREAWKLAREQVAQIPGPPA